MSELALKKERRKMKNNKEEIVYDYVFFANRNIKDIHVSNEIMFVDFFKFGSNREKVIDKDVQDFSKVVRTMLEYVYAKNFDHVLNETLCYDIENCKEQFIEFYVDGRLVEKFSNLELASKHALKYFDQKNYYNSGNCFFVKNLKEAK